MRLASNAFNNLDPIPKQYSELGGNLSPPFSWTDVPAGTQELALIGDDPDAPTAEPWVHWVIYGLSPDLTGLPEGIAREKVITVPIRALQGRNSLPANNIGYEGPNPPQGHGVHRYYFTLYALDTGLKIPPGATKKDLLEAMQGHVLVKTELIGTYERFLNR
ncbi:MAG: YbhB/YbcL family Raf kinase inhibitor-like protein [Planctomycetaceae bacterium]|jgi:Raf kinase inhibitor-like YbhB/YbcL family protein|nr:YbhB/YbcL family Raf kinase inhibitor-like protein [Planctomycetaceae bacterium]